MEKMFKKKSSGELGTLATLTPTLEIITVKEFRENFCKFNNYSREITLSPKGSRMLQLPKCACGATQIMPMLEQREFMLDILSEVFHKLKISGLIVFEEYKCHEYYHCHGIINFINDSKIRKLNKMIAEHYFNHNRHLLNIKPIRNMEEYMKYMVKDQDETSEIFITKEIYDVPPPAGVEEKLEKINNWKKEKCSCQMCSYCCSFE